MARPIAKTLMALGICLALAAPATAAEQQDTSPSDSAELKARSEQMLESLQDYSAQKRDQAIDEAGDLVAALDARIRELQEKLDRQWDDTSEAARENTREALASLKDERAALARAYDELKESSASAWTQVKQGFIESYRTVRDSLMEADEKP